MSRGEESQEGRVVRGEWRASDLGVEDLVGVGVEDVVGVAVGVEDVRIHTHVCMYYYVCVYVCAHGSACVCRYAYLQHMNVVSLCKFYVF